MIRLASALVSVCVAVGVSPAYAQPSASCRHVEREIDGGIALRERELHQAALDVFVGVSRRCPSPRVTAQIALAEAALHRWGDAGRHMSEALASANDPWVTSRRAALEGALAEFRRHLVEVRPRVTPEGAEVWVNGARVASLPTWIDPGRYRLEVRAAGHHPWQRVGELHEGERFDERVALASNAPPPAAPLVGRTPPRAAPPAETPTVTPPARWAGFALAGAGGVTLVAAVIVWAHADGLAEDTRWAAYNSPGELGAWARYENTVNLQRALTPSQVCERARADTTADAALAAGLCRSRDASATAFYALTAAGVAMVGAGLALVFLNPPRPRARVSWSVVPFAAPRVAGAALDVRF
jgi:hypothetical protein